MTDHALDERFEAETLPPQLRWHCEPDEWSLDPVKHVLRVSPRADTDFWQRTHYGFEADTGHFLFLNATGNFVLTTKVTSRPCHQYDQAGLMVRVSRSCWLKASVEFEPDEPNRLGAVVTNHQYSDWSTQPLSSDIHTIWFRARMVAADVIVDSSLDGVEWQQLRVAHLSERPSAASVACGLYACSPKGAGFAAEFGFLTFAPESAECEHRVS